MTVKNIILGTAGHIDHGKSSLVKALTGTDPDRLKEEKLRGITIDLGFANLAYPDGVNVGIVDVPGHEKLIKNMLAGAGGIDILLFVISAEEGIMPQTREHFAICSMLNIPTGIIALTKADLVDEDWLTLMTDEVKAFVGKSFLKDAPIVAVSAKTGFNIESLKQIIHDIALRVKPKATDGLFRLPIDRVFTLKGFGTVVTGTMLSGTVHLDEQVQILPSGITTKVKGLQTHGRAVKTAYAGQRTGINLQGVDKEMLKRGDVVTVCDKVQSTSAVDVYLELTDTAPTVKSRTNVHFYTGTAETVARVVLYEVDALEAGQRAYAQLRLSDPVVCLSGDRFIIRRFSPLETIGGGVILDPYPIRRKRSHGIADLEVFANGTLRDKLLAKLRRKHCRYSELEGFFAESLSVIKDALTALQQSGSVVSLSSYLVHIDNFTKYKDTIISFLTAYHSKNPLKHGASKAELKTALDVKDDKFFDALIGAIKEITVDQDTVRLQKFKVSLSHSEQNLKEKIAKILHESAFSSPDKTAIASELSIPLKQTDDLLKLMAKEGSLVRINDSTYITKAHYDKMISLLRQAFSKKSELTVSEFKDMLGISRKFALPLLEYLDSHKITLRVGDVRKFLLK